MANEIAPGDVVKLKSGGPKMTVVAVDVAEITEELTVWCEWFDEDRMAKHAEFSLVAVEKFVPREPRVISGRGPHGWMGN